MNPSTFVEQLVQALEDAVRAELGELRATRARSAPSAGRTFDEGTKTRHALPLSKVQEALKGAALPLPLRGAPRAAAQTARRGAGAMVQ